MYEDIIANTNPNLESIRQWLTLRNENINHSDAHFNIKRNMYANTYRSVNNHNSLIDIFNDKIGLYDDEDESEILSDIV
jgi:hypothetical protein